MRAGIKRVLFVTGRRKRAIEDHFDLDLDPELEHGVGAGPLIDPRSGLQILYTRQMRPARLGGALRYAEGFAGEPACEGGSLSDRLLRLESRFPYKTDPISRG